MGTVSILLIGFGILLLGLGTQFLRAHYTQGTSNEELEWAGFGDHPFRNKP